MTSRAAPARSVRVAVLAGSLATAAVVAGCTSVGPAPTGAPGPATNRPATAASSSATAVAAPTSATPSSSGAPVTSVEAGSATPTIPTTSAAAPAAGAGAPAAAPRSTCTALTIRVLRGSAAPGYEFAALQFENTGTTRCTLYGYPTVTLVSGGRQVGSASTPAGAQPSAYVLNPGQVAESRLQDYSSCQAPLSDRIKVVAPRSSSLLVRPIQLRACRLTVSRLDAPQ